MSKEPEQRVMVTYSETPHFEFTRQTNPWRNPCINAGCTEAPADVAAAFRKEQEEKEKG